MTHIGESMPASGWPRRQSQFIVGAIGGAAVTAALALVLVVAGPGSHSSQQSAAQLQGASPAASAARSQSGTAGSAALDGPIAAIYQKARPAVVEIDVSGSGGRGLGSGVIISDKGEILTNAHVVSGARRLQVKLSDGTILPATVKGVNDNDDLAIVQATVPKDKLAVISLGDSSALQPGQQVVAIGNPFGLEGSVTQGIVSGIRNDQSGQGPSKVIQIDAAINPGNSGGPLLDMRGNLVGINEALENPTGQDVFVGIGFAIPVETAKADLNQLRSGGVQANAPTAGGRNSGSGSSRGGSGQGGSGSPYQGGSGNPNQGGSGNPNQGGSGNPYQGGSGNPNQGGSGNPSQGGSGNPFQNLPGNPFQGGGFGG